MSTKRQSRSILYPFMLPFITCTVLRLIFQKKLNPFTGGGLFAPPLPVRPRKPRIVARNGLGPTTFVKKNFWGRSILRSPEVITNKMVLNDLDRSTSKFDLGRSHLIPIDASHDQVNSLVPFTSLAPSCRDLLAKHYWWPHITSDDPSGCPCQ